jgi:hypothetical protein
MASAARILIDAEVRRRLAESGRTCRRGHIRTEESWDRAQRRCRECHALEMREWRAGRP